MVCPIPQGDHNKVITFKGYSFYHSYASEVNDVARGSSAILVNSSTPHRQLNLQTCLQAVTIRVTCRKTITVCSTYLPTSTVFNANDFYARFLVFLLTRYSELCLFYLNITHTSDHSHLCSLKCHLIFFPDRPGLTSVQHTTLHKAAIQLQSQHTKNQMNICQNSTIANLFLKVIVRTYRITHTHLTDCSIW